MRVLLRLRRLIMWDGCDPVNLPRKARVVAGYIDGPCRWPPGGWSAFPKARKVRITTTANVLADVFDWERGTASLGRVRQAVLDRSFAYLPSVIYVSLSKWAVAEAALEGLSVAWWVADWTGEPHLPAGAVACQYASLADYDVSVVSPAWPRA